MDASFQYSRFSSCRPPARRRRRGTAHVDAKPMALELFGLCDIGQEADQIADRRVELFTESCRCLQTHLQLMSNPSTVMFWPLSGSRLMPPFRQAAAPPLQTMRCSP